MTTSINAADFLVQEAADKLLEVMVCTGAYDVGEVDSDAAALALADRILADVRARLAVAVRRDALALAADGAVALADLDAAE